MTSEELRELASTLEQCSPYRDSASVYQAAAHLRACADALEAGPVAWQYKAWHGDAEGSLCLHDPAEFRDPQISDCRPLYPVALPTQPVSVADKLPADRIEAIAHRAATFYRHDEARGHEYMFKRSELLYFAARLLAEAIPTSNACQLQSFGNPEQLAIPQGWRLVPVEPTPEMCAGSAVASSSINRHIYKTMLAAAPTPPVAAQSLRLPEPMTSSEIGDYARSMVKAGRSVDWLVMQIEAEVLRRVREVNE